jgi:hypothetical protein
MNSFSLNTLREFSAATVSVRSLTLDEAKILAREAVSAVGHPDTATLFADCLGIDVTMNRQTVVMASGDRALVGQHVGERLPVGTVFRPIDSEIRWLIVEVIGDAPWRRPESS